MSWTWIVLLWALGVAALLAEVFVSLTVFGVLGLLLVGGAVALTFAEHGPLVGVGVSLASLLVGAALFKLGAARFTHVHSMEGSAGVDDRSALVGRRGQATTVLRPGGVADFDGQRVDVVATGEHLPAGTPLQVVAVEGSHVTVRRYAD